MSSDSDNPKDFVLINRPGSGDEKLVIIGSKDQIIPTDLILDTSITGDELRLWTIIRHLAKSSIQDMPTQEALAKMLDKSRPTINHGLQVLRILRWLTIIQDDDRNSHGQFNQLTYAIHNHRMPIVDTIDLDPGYTKFLSDKSIGSAKRLRQCAIDTLTDVNAYLRLGTTPNNEIITNPGDGLLIVAPTSKPPRKTISVENDIAVLHKKKEPSTSISFGSSLDGRGTAPPKAIDQPKSTTPAVEAKQDKRDVIQWHRHFEQLPNSLRTTILKLVQKHELNDSEADIALKATVKRIENPALPPIDVLPSYIESMIRRAKTGELYDSDAAKKSTANKKKEKARQSAQSALQRRGLAVSLRQDDKESTEDFESRIANAEYDKQMKRLGQKV